MSQERTLAEFLEVARALKEYLYADNLRPKPIWFRNYVRMAARLMRVDINKRLGAWFISYPSYLRKRLDAAGIDLDTFQITDERKAAWTWYQLRTNCLFSEKFQWEALRGEHPEALNLKLMDAKADSPPDPVARQILDTIRDRYGWDR